MVTFRPLLRDSISIVWNHKFLWFFGLFAALMGAGGELDILFSYNDTIAGNESAFLAMKELFRDGTLGWSNIWTNTQANPVSTLLTLAIAIALFAFLAWLISVSQGALIAAASQTSKKQKTAFDTTARIGQQNVKRLFALNVIYKGIIYGLLVLLAIPLVLTVSAGESTVTNTLITLASFFVIVPINIIVGFVVRFAAAYVVLEQKPIGEALRLGLQLFFKNWLVSLEMAVILLVVNILAGVGVLIGAGILILPFLVLWFIFSLVSLPIVVNVVLILALVTVLLFAFSAAGAISAYQWNVWTLLFLRLVKGKAVSKLHRIAESFSPNAVK